MGEVKFRTLERGVAGERNPTSPTGFAGYSVMTASFVFAGVLALHVPTPLRHAPTPLRAARASPLQLSAAPPQPSLRSFLQADAGVDGKFVDAVLGICDEEMIGDVASLVVARDAGLLDELFKPVVWLGIESALGRLTPGVSAPAKPTPPGGSSGAAKVTPLAALEVRCSDGSLWGGSTLTASCAAVRWSRTTPFCPTCR